MRISDWSSDVCSSDLGAMLVALATQIRARRRIRWHAIVSRFQTVGVDALPIIGLMSFLIGIVIAQQGAVQLRQFGLEVFTINLVGRASIRELGLLDRKSTRLNSSH